VWPRGNGRAGQCDRLCGLVRIIVSIPVSRALKSALFTRNWIPVFTFFIVFQFLILIFVTSPIKRRRTYYLKGVYLDVLSSMFPNFATSELYKKTSNSRCPCRLYSYASCASNGTGRLQHTISLCSGQCEGLETWDEREVQFPRIFCIYVLLWIKFVSNCLMLGSWGGRKINI